MCGHEPEQETGHKLAEKCEVNYAVIVREITPQRCGVTGRVVAGKRHVTRCDYMSVIMEGIDCEANGGIFILTTCNHSLSREVPMGRKREADTKSDALRRKGALNRKPESVSDARFAADEFFDARDLVQVKYEMLRRVRAEDWSVTEAAGVFGMSRFSYYEAKEALERDGLPGLVPRKPGPRSRHKMTPEVVVFVRTELANDVSLSIRDLPVLVKERFGLVVHRRTIERALDGPGKRGL